MAEARKWILLRRGTNRIATSAGSGHQNRRFPLPSQDSLIPNMGIRYDQTLRTTPTRAPMIST